MELKYSDADEAFRLEVRDWIGKNLPQEMRGASQSGGSGIYGQSNLSVLRAWYKKLADRGWYCRSWSKEAGGPGFTAAQQMIFREEAGRAGAPPEGMGPSMIGPLMIDYGTPDQKKKFLEPILKAETIWCQGYSEPNAGSDLAGLALQADLDGDDYVLNGQKIWTSGAANADWIFVLVRTDRKSKHSGITFLVADMRSPGITIKPIRQITDEAHFYETFFVNVRVPVANRIGSENGGWAMAKALLAYERTSQGNDRPTAELLRTLETVARETPWNGGTAIEDKRFRMKFAQLKMENEALRATMLRNQSKILRGIKPGSESSILKLYATELFQKVGDLALETLGPNSQAWGDSMAELAGAWPQLAIGSRAMTIYGGTSEIQRNIISERVLGLPHEPELK